MWFSSGSMTNFMIQFLNMIKLVHLNFHTMVMEPYGSTINFMIIINSNCDIFFFKYINWKCEYSKTLVVTMLKNSTFYITQKLKFLHNKKFKLWHNGSKFCNHTILIIIISTMIMASRTVLFQVIVYVIKHWTIARSFLIWS